MSIQHSHGTVLAAAVVCTLVTAGYAADASDGGGGRPWASARAPGPPAGEPKATEPTAADVAAATATVASTPVGFSSLTSVPPYEYGPTISLVGETYHMWYCSPGANGAWDFIRHSTSADGLSWAAPDVALQPTTAFDRDSVCDPSVVQHRGTWLMYHTCINTRSGGEGPPDGYTNNRICLATADAPTGPWTPAAQPVVQHLNCTRDWKKAYCAGQPSAVTHRGKVFLYYTLVSPGDSTPPNPGDILVATSDDGVTFAPPQGPVLTQRDVDVKVDRASGLFFLAQGDVGSDAITWSTSADGITWAPYNGSALLRTNPALPKGGTNNNPGLAGLPDGSFSGQTFAMYGSSYKVGWGDWHLYRTDVVVDPAQADCSSCAGTHSDCDRACAQVTGKASYGTCAVPGSTDPSNCCSCAPYPAVPDCSACAPSGCSAACGAKAGVCAAPGSTDPTRCCRCM